MVNIGRGDLYMDMMGTDAGPTLPEASVLNLNMGSNHYLHETSHSDLAVKVVAAKH